MERGNLSSRCEGKTSSGEPDKRESTDAGHRGGSARSSGEVPVMGMERRGRRIHNGPEANWKRDEPRGQMECCYASQEATAAWNTKSRMMGDYQVRFRERLGVKFPRPTRPALRPFESLVGLGSRFARIRSLHSATLRLAYARRNVAGRNPLYAMPLVKIRSACTSPPVAAPRCTPPAPQREPLVLLCFTKRFVWSPQYGWPQPRPQATLGPPAMRHPARRQRDTALQYHQAGDRPLSGVRSPLAAPYLSEPRPAGREMKKGKLKKLCDYWEGEALRRESDAAFWREQYLKRLAR